MKPYSKFPHQTQFTPRVEGLSLKTAQMYNTDHICNQKQSLRKRNCCYCFKKLCFWLTEIIMLRLTEIMMWLTEVMMRLTEIVLLRHVTILYFLFTTVIGCFKMQIVNGLLFIYEDIWLWSRDKSKQNNPCFDCSFTLYLFPY